MQRHIVMKFVIHIIAVADCLFVCLIVTHQYWHIVAKVKHPASATNASKSSQFARQLSAKRIQAVVRKPSYVPAQQHCGRSEDINAHHNARHMQYYQQVALAANESSVFGVLLLQQLRPHKC
jgi:hypothetical protein